MTNFFKLKCGILSSDGQWVDDSFKFFTWAGPTAPKAQNEEQITLSERAKQFYPEIVEPFQIVFIDEDEDHVAIPAHDTAETVSALCCYTDPINYKPIRIFVQQLGAQAETPHKPRPTSTPTTAGQMDLSLQRTIQNLGDRLINQMNCLQLALTDSISKLVKHSDVAIEEVIEKMEKI